MNLFYEDYPAEIIVNGSEIPILTDFRDYVRLLDMLKDTEIDPFEKYEIICLYFKERPSDFEEAFDELIDFITMKQFHEKHASGDAQNSEEVPQKEVYSFSVDYPFIFSAFLRDYGINLRTIPYMHWWEFRLLFDGLSDDTEIKQRILYRSIDLNEVKDKDEKKRIEKIQRAIRLPSEELVTDYEIGDALW